MRSLRLKSNKIQVNKNISMFLVIVLVITMITTGNLVVKAESNLIDFKLDSSNEVLVKNNEQVVVSYKGSIKGNVDIPSDTDNNNLKIEEAIFIVDLSQAMREYQRFSFTSNAMVNKIINSNFRHLNVGVIGYNENLYVANVIQNNNSEMKRISDVNEINNLQEPLTSLQNTEPMRRLFAENHLNNLFSNSENSNNNRNISKALDAADYILTNKGASDKGKAIVLITAGNAKLDYSNEQINKFKAKGYKVISLDISRNTSDNKLKELHNTLGGSENDYFVGTTDNMGNNFNFTDSDMQKVADSLNSGIVQSSDKTITPELTFDLGDEIKYLGCDTPGVNTKVEGNILKVYIPSIVYEKIANNLYNPDKTIIDLDLRFEVDDINNDKIATFKSAVIKYNNLNNKNVEKDIDTPIFRFGDEEVDESVDIRILEIEPADSFAITKYSKKYIQSGTEVASVQTENGEIKKIAIDHISMPEFIGKTDKINGAYDVIFIGRYIDSENITSTKNQDQLAYRDYGDGTITIQNKSSNINNDITNRKAEEIIEYINSGQLVYIDNSIISNNKDNNRRDLSSKNIYNRFKDISKSNLKSDEIDYSKEKLLQTIVNEYYSFNIADKSKRVSLEVNPPIGDNESDIQGDVNNRNLEFDINISDKFNKEANKEEDVNVNLYLDINGDGLYKEDELFVTENCKLSSSVKLNYVVPYDFVGYLSWKVEVVREKSNGYSENCKTYMTGEMLLRQVSGKKKIRVLEVSPYETQYLFDKIGQTESQWHLGNLNLQENERFQKLISSLPDYDIDITTISMGEFNTSDEKLNGNYDMIIFGFADNFRSWDLKDKGITKIEEFIKTGQGIMLTHDTLTVSGLENFKKIFNSNESENLAGLTNELTLAHMNKLEWPNFQTKEVYQTNSGIITKYPFLLDDTISIRRTHGQWYQLDLENEDVIPWYTGTPNTVWSSGTSGQNSNGSIKDYSNGIEEDPLADELEKELIRNYGSIDSANRSIESDDNWFTNNLKVKDGVSYDGLNTNTEYINQYDVRNNYYTYSSGNITFSGTGENNKERNTPYPTSELELFVNTIIKAERLANHAPVINTTIPELKDETVLIPYNKDYVFDVTPTDIDQDNVKLTIQIEMKSDNGDTEIIYEDELQKQGTTRTITIPSSKWNNEFDKVFSIKIEAEDEHGAKSQKVYIMETSKDILLNVEYDGGKGLVGEDIVSSIVLSNTEDSNISSIKLEIGEYSEALFNKVELSKNEFDALNDGKVETTLFTNTKVEVNGSYIPINISFKAGNRDIVMQTIIPIYSKEPYINVNIKSDVDIEDDFLPQVLLSTLEKIVDTKDGYSASWNNEQEIILNSDKYKVEIGNLTDKALVIGKYELRRSEEGEVEDSVSDNLFEINYYYPEAYIDITLVNAVSNLKHGLYKGFDNYGKVEILENPTGFEVVNNMTVNYGSTFTIGGNGAIINLELPLKLVPYKNETEENLNNIKLYKSVNNNGKYSYEELSFNIKRDMLFNGNKESYGINYVIKINDIIQGDTDILMTYTADIPYSEYQQQYTNKITIGNLSKDVRVFTTSSELPDLY